jgi:transposase
VSAKETGLEAQERRPTVEHCGIDLHQKSSQLTVVDEEGEVLERATIASTDAAIRRWFGRRPRMRVLLEASGSSPWVARLLVELGHEVNVIDPKRVRWIAQSTLKTDRIDADTLAELVRLRTRLRTLVWQRSEVSQRQRGHLRVRRALVEARAGFIVTVRGLLRSFGVRVASCRSDRFAARCQATAVPAELVEVITPLLAAIRELDARVAEMDTVVERVGQLYPAVDSFKAIPGVGPVVALAFVLSIEDPRRFSRSRDVPGYLGLRPNLRTSADTVRRGRITKEGDADVRRLLVQAAHAHLRSNSDTALKRWAEGLVPRIGKHKAIVALARKLAVLMHHLWITGEVYHPFPVDQAKVA